MKKTNETLTAISRWLGDTPGAAPGDAVTGALDALYRRPPTADQIQAAQARLRRALAEERKRTVWYDSIANPRLGRVFFAATTGGLVSVAFGLGERAFRERLRATIGVEAAPASGQLRQIGRQLREYLAGRRTRFDLPLDLRALPEFQRRVLQAALEIPRGQVMTYSQIAQSIGRPRAARAVGQALGRNPMPIVIPCHRVVAADGSLRGYSGGGGARTKAWLLALEGAHF